MDVNQSSDDEEYSVSIIKRPLYEAIEPLVPTSQAENIVNVKTGTVSRDDNAAPSDATSASSEDDYSERDDYDDDDDDDGNDVDYDERLGDENDDTKDCNFDEVDESLVDAFYADVNACEDEDADDDDAEVYNQANESKFYYKMINKSPETKSPKIILSQKRHRSPSAANQKVSVTSQPAAVAKSGNYTKISETSLPITTGPATRTTTSSTPTTPKMVHAQTSDNKLVLVTIVKENGKIYVPVTKQSSSPSAVAAATSNQTNSLKSILSSSSSKETIATVVTSPTTSQVPKLKIISHHGSKVGNIEPKINLSTELPEIKHKQENTMEKLEIKITKKKSAMEDSTSPQLSATRAIVNDIADECFPLRSSTPLSQKGLREFLALQKSLTQSKILSEFVNDLDKPRKSRKAPLKDDSESLITAAGNSTGVKRAKDGRSKSFSRSKYSESPTPYDIPAGRANRRSRSKSFREENVPPLNASNNRALRRSRSKSIIIHDDKKSTFGYRQVTTTLAGPLRKSRSKSVRGGEHDSLNISNPMKSNFPFRRSRSKSSINEDKNYYFPITINSINNKRSNMRSQNADFVQKTRKFFNSVMKDEDDLNEQQQQSESDQLNYNKTLCEKQTTDQMLAEPTSIVASSSSLSSSSSSFNATSAAIALEEYLEGVWHSPPKCGSDSFCWKCGKCGQLVPCSKCIRSFHVTCTKAKVDKNWTCPECVIIENVHNGQKKSKNKTSLSVDLLHQLLLFALKRMKEVKGYEKFLHLPDKSEFPSFSKYIINPVTLTSLQEKIEKRSYRCAEEFVSDTKWIQHNNSIINCANATNKDSIIAKALIKVCRQEAAEIETCSECYLNANTRSDWFVDICSRPHILVWAKLKGFPYWPAKAMGPGQGALVNVRFFGDHDRAFVPVKDCYLYSEQDPNPQNAKRNSRTAILTECIKEVAIHIEKIRTKIGAFKYAAFKKSYDPSDEMRQLEEMMPGVGEYMKRQQIVQKPPLQYKIVKTAGNQMSIIKKPDSGTDSDHSSSFSVALGENSENSKMKNPRVIISITSTTTTTTTTATVSPTVVESTNTQKSCSSYNHSNSKSKSSGNYEVISKSNKDESNSSKINSVILKRKSDTSNVVGAHTDKCNTGGGDDSSNSVGNATVSFMKRQKTSISESDVIAKEHISSLDKNDVSVEGTVSKKDITPIKSSSVKRKYSVTPPKLCETDQNGLQSKSKHVKPDIPALVKNSNNSQTSLKVLTTTSTTSVINSNILEALTKNKQSLTIKKISSPKIVEITTVAESSMINKTTASTVLSVNESSTTNAVSSCFISSNVNSETVPPVKIAPPSIITGLIPFEDIKTEAPDENHKTPDIEISLENNKLNKNVPFTTVIQTNTLPIPLLLQEVKQEPLSDNDNQDQEMLNSSSGVTINGPVIPMHVDDGSPQTDMTSTHRIAVRNINMLKEVLPNLVSQSMPTETSNKRNTVTSRGGIPFGPLPANAIKSAAAGNQSQSKTSSGSFSGESNINFHRQQQNQRARKSFPNKSTNAPTSSLITNAGPLSSTLVCGGSNDNVSVGSRVESMTNKDLKRSLLRNSMVSIPVDCSGDYGNRNHSIPIPPLTAVLKTSSASMATNCNSSLSQTTKLPPTTAAALTGPGSVNASVIVSELSTTITATATVNNNPLRPMSAYTTSMSAPPPLAGLSSSSTCNNNNQSSDKTNNTATANLTNTRTQIQSTPPITTISSSSSSSTATITTSATSMTSITSTTSTTTVNCGTRCSLSVDDRTNNSFTISTATTMATTTTAAPPPKLSRGIMRSDECSSQRFLSQAGPVSRTLTENAHKMTDFFISLMKDTMVDMACNDNLLQAKVALLTIDLEQAKQAHEREIAEIKLNTDIMLCNMKKSLEQEKTNLIADIRRQCELERLHSVEETKKKQWCANCGREALLICCWNTSYCDYPCQQLHWNIHSNVCTQNLSNNCEISNTAPNVLPRTTTMMLTTQATSLTNSLSSFSSSSANQEFSGSNPAGQKVNSGQHNNSSMSQFLLNAGSKKDKTRPNASYPASAAASASSAPSSYLNKSLAAATPEVLKLPSSTYVRAVPVISRGGNGGGGGGGVIIPPPPIPIHRFNVPLPITAPANSGPPYTLVNREGNWELMGTSMQSTQATLSVSTVPAPLMSSHQQQNINHHHPPPPPQLQSNNYHSRAHSSLAPHQSASMLGGCVPGGMGGMIGSGIICNGNDPTADVHTAMNRGIMSALSSATPSSNMLYTTATNCPPVLPAYMRSNIQM